MGLVALGCDLVPLRLLGSQAAQSQRAEATRLLQDRLATVGTLLAERRGQLEKLLDLYLAGSFPQEVLTDRQKRLGDTIAALEQERVALADQLERRTLSETQVCSIIEYASEVAQGLEVAGQSHEARRHVIEMLDVNVTLAVEDGQRIAYASTLCGSGSFPLATSSIGRIGWRS